MEIDVYSSRAQFQTSTNYDMEYFSPAGCTWIGQISMAFFFVSFCCRRRCYQKQTHIIIYYDGEQLKGPLRTKGWQSTETHE